MGPANEPLPDGFAVALDSGTRWVSDTLLLGGDPQRLVRVSGAVGDVVRRLSEGAAVGDLGAAAGSVARRMVRWGLAHPVPPPGAGAGSAIALVIPAKNAAATMPGLLASVGPVSEAIVVDDGSTDGTGDAARAAGAAVIRNEVSQGPAAARNAGLARVTAPLTLFLDADVALSPSWRQAVGHLADPAVGAVVMRIVPPPAPASPGLAERYERVRSPYDLGPGPGRVERGSRRPSAGGAAIVARTAALREVGGFDAGLRFGEDVELFWALGDAGWTVRYEPEALAAHGVRTELAPLLREHYRYGTPAAELARRHGHRSGGAMAPSTLAAAGLAAAGWARLGAAVAGGAAAGMAVRLVREGVPPTEAAKLAARWQVRSARTVAAVSTGALLPAGLAASAVSRRARWGIAAAWAGRHVNDWRQARPPIGLPTWLALRTADDAAGSAGVWAGMARAGGFGAVTPVWSRPFSGPAPDDIPGWTTVAMFP